MSTQSGNCLLPAYDFFKSGDPESAKAVLEEALSADLENKEIAFALLCANFWIDRLRRCKDISAFSDQGEYLIANWKQFAAYIENESSGREQILYAVKQGIFSQALECFKSILRSGIQAQKVTAYSRIGLCQKMLGNYENALTFLAEANSKAQNSAPILAEMADCYALCGDDRTAKVLFREAFYIDAQHIDIALLESELICRLAGQVENLGYTGAVLKEWIAVYGVLFGVFSLKRELRAAEVLKLKQDIYSLENELKGAACEPDVLIPRLINHYFWLVDYYTTVHDDRSRINEVMLKIKLLDTDIYEKYIK